MYIRLTDGKRVSKSQTYPQNLVIPYTSLLWVFFLCRYSLMVSIGYR